MCYQFLTYCIAGHHAGLPDTGGVCDMGTCGRYNDGKNEEEAGKLSGIQKEIEIPLLKNLSFQLVKAENPGFFFSMLIGMLYSGLVDSDYLDTEFFMKGKEIRDRGELISKLYESFYSRV